MITLTNSQQKQKEDVFEHILLYTRTQSQISFFFSLSLVCFLPLGRMTCFKKLKIKRKRSLTVKRTAARFIVFYCSYCCNLDKGANDCSIDLQFNRVGMKRFVAFLKKDSYCLKGHFCCLIVQQIVV